MLILEGMQLQIIRKQILHLVILTKMVSGAIKAPNANTILALGTNPSGTNAQQGAWLNGKIYSVHIYNRALTDEEIAQNYAIDKARFGIEE